MPRQQHRQVVLRHGQLRIHLQRLAIDLLRLGALPQLFVKPCKIEGSFPGVRLSLDFGAIFLLGARHVAALLSDEREVVMRELHVRALLQCGPRVLLGFVELSALESHDPKRVFG